MVVSNVKKLSKSKGVKLGRPRISSFAEIARLRDEGLSLNQIGREVGCDKSTVSKVLKKGSYKGVGIKEAHVEGF